MERFEVTILGCGSAKPNACHFPSAQIVNVHDKLYMIDCGEGAQIQMCRNHINFSRLDNIFISHLHGDHCFGLIGLISTYNLLGRNSDLNIYAPNGLGETLEVLIKAYCREMTYRVIFHSVDTKANIKIFEDHTVEIYSLPLKHRIPCCGYMVCEKQKLPHIKRDMIDFYKIPFYAINKIKQGQPWITEEGNTIPYERLTTPADKARKYAYCSDTIYIPQLKDLIEGVDLLYHESTFGKDNEPRAKETFHSTAEQAATLAKDSKVKKLVIGHFSSRYNNEERSLLTQAQAVFKNTSLAKENKTFEIK